MTPRRLIATSVGAGLLLGGATGLAVTLPGGANAAETDSTVSATERPAGPMSGMLDGLVADGTITQEQADAIRSTAEARRAERGDAGMGGKGRHGGPGAGMRGGETPGADRLGGRGGPGGGMRLDSAAEAIGISPEDLRAGLRSGQSLAQIAEANGVGTDELVDRLTTDARERISEMVQRVPGQHSPGSNGPGNGSDDTQTN
jgi:hypothetical protein